MDNVEERNETALPASNSDLLDEAQALSEMSRKVKNLEAENAELLVAKRKYYDSILNGQTVEEVAQYRTLDEIRKDLFQPDRDEISNLDYAKLALELDDACIRETGQSCFIPVGTEVTPTVDEKDVAVRFHELLEQAIADSNGDRDTFNSILGRYIKDKKRG